MLGYTVIAGYGVENLPWCLKEKQNGALTYFDFLKIIKAMITLSVKGYIDKPHFLSASCLYFLIWAALSAHFSICWDPTPPLSLPVATLSMKRLKPTQLCRIHSLCSDVTRSSLLSQQQIVELYFVFFFLLYVFVSLLDYILEPGIHLILNPL